MHRFILIEFCSQGKRKPHVVSRTYLYELSVE